MGSRDRRDPAGHKTRAKGAPTPKQTPGHVNGSRIEPATDAAEQLAAPLTAEGVPPSQSRAFALGVAAAGARHPQVDEALLDVTFVVPGGVVGITFPLFAWETIRERIDDAYKEATEGVPADSGLVIGGDVAAEAAAAEQRAAAERKARGEG